MSRIYFHSPSGEAELRGSERAYMSVLCSDLTAAVLRPVASYSGAEPPAILRLIVTDSYLHTVEPGRFTEMFNTWLSVGMSGFTIDGQTQDTFTVCLNTALRMGSDPIKLMARLRGQCEIHCYVDGPNRPWLADIIEHGRDLHIMRSGEGWEDVAALLRQRTDEPVVCSYSVCDGFPNSDVADWTPPDEGEYDGEPSDAWYDLDSGAQWRLAMAGLRKRHVELKPDTWADYYFDSGMDAFQIADRLSAERLATA